MPTTLKLDAETERRLRRLAELSGRSAADQLAEIIAAGIEDLEDVEAAERVQARIVSGKEKVYSSEQLRIELT